jgi:hypothetical protein
VTRSALIAICWIHLLGAAPAPVIRAVIESPAPIIVGQAVRVRVSVLVPNYFMGQPDFPQFNMDDAIVVLPGETPENSNETIAGESYAGISVTYLVYPQQPASFKLPDVEIGVKYAANPPKSAEARLRLPSLTFDAVIPPQAADLDYFLPTTSLTVRQKLDKPLKDLRVGDTFTRTVTISASKLRAMLIPPTRFEAPNGITVYPKQAAVDDIKTNRGEFVQGRRVDSATYVIRKQGSYTLPEIRLQWWDLAAHKIRTATVPLIRFDALPSPSYHPEIAPEPEPTLAPVPAQTNGMKRYLRLAEITSISLFGVALLVWISLHFIPRLRKHWDQARRLHKNSEANYFHELRRACKAEAPEQIYPLLIGWLRRFRPGVPLTEFLRETADPELISQVDSVAAILFKTASTGNLSGRRMSSALQRVRSHERSEKVHRCALPPLNP